VKSGIVGDVKWNRAPKKFVLNQDPNPVLTKAWTPWRGMPKKSDIFFQILIKACSSDRSIVADLSAGTGSSVRACRASGRHFFGLEDDNDIFEELLKPLTMPEREDGYSGENRKRKGDSCNV
jgi:hypothetical protein